MVYYQDITSASLLYTHMQETVNLSVKSLSSAGYQIINPWLDSIVLIWSLGFLFQGYRFITDIIFTQQLKNQGVFNLPLLWEQQLQGLVSKIGVKTNVTFLQSSKVNIPVVIGYIKPVILLPLGILTQLPEAQIKAIVLHELAHIKRHDYLINIVQCMVKVLFFFNPFVLAISKTIDIERENACDDIAVKISGDPIAFARSLSSFAEISTSSQTALAATKDRYFLLARVKRLFNKKQNLSHTTERLIALVCIGLLGLTVNAHANNHNVLVTSYASAGISTTNSLIKPQTPQKRIEPKPIDIKKIKNEQQVKSPNIDKSPKIVSVVDTPKLSESAINFIENNKRKDNFTKEKLKPISVEDVNNAVKEEPNKKVNDTKYYADKSLTNRISIFEADRLFDNKQYHEAKVGYLAASQLGSPHAYYQLGTILLEGLGVTQDNVSAYIWFSMATEYNFNNSKLVAQQVYSQLNDKQQHHANKLLSMLKRSFSKAMIQNDYFPIIKNENLGEKVTFGGSGKLDVNYHDTDLMLDELSANFDGSGTQVYELSSGESAVSHTEPTYSSGPGNPRRYTTGTEDPIYGVQLRPQSRFSLTRRRAPFLIVDYDVGPDGSIRNVTPVQEIGYTRHVKERFEFNKFAAPNFKDTRVSFVNRTYIGAATYSKFKMHDRNETLYDEVRRQAKNLERSNVQEDQHQYAMMLLTFKWLKQDEGEAQARLKVLAENGHPIAQFELGAKLYREQTDIEAGIYWISEASKYGLPRAEYLLANIIQNSPWVVNDEKKALFWYESALAKDHLAAKLKASELKMLATDVSLHDFNSAINYLENMQEAQRNNPEYYFLKAIAVKNNSNRDFTQVIEYVEKAIDLGEKYNWDVSYWQGLVEKWTTGKVYIADS